MKESMNLSGTEITLPTTSTTAAGRVKNIKIHLQTISGEKLRQSLNLPSLWLEFQVKNNTLIVNSRGYGHGVGMCQYGSNGMAAQDYSFSEILNFYYQEIELFHLPY
jgi:stage II sporulation protein D